MKEWVAQTHVDRSLDHQTPYMEWETWKSEDGYTMMKPETLEQAVDRARWFKEELLSSNYYKPFRNFSFRLYNVNTKEEIPFEVLEI